MTQKTELVEKCYNFFASSNSNIFLQYSDAHMLNQTTHIIHSLNRQRTFKTRTHTHSTTHNTYITHITLHIEAMQDHANISGDDGRTMLKVCQCQQAVVLSVQLRDNKFHYIVKLNVYRNFILHCLWECKVECLFYSDDNLCCLIPIEYGKEQSQRKVKNTRLYFSFRALPDSQFTTPNQAKALSSSLDIYIIISRSAFLQVSIHKGPS